MNDLAAIKITMNQQSEALNLLNKAEKILEV